MMTKLIDLVRWPRVATTYLYSSQLVSIKWLATSQIWEKMATREVAKNPKVSWAFCREFAGRHGATRCPLRKTGRLHFWAFAARSPGRLPAPAPTDPDVPN